MHGGWRSARQWSMDYSDLLCYQTAWDVSSELLSSLIALCFFSFSCPRAAATEFLWSACCCGLASSILSVCINFLGRLSVMMSSNFMCFSSYWCFRSLFSLYQKNRSRRYWLVKLGHNCMPNGCSNEWHTCMYTYKGVVTSATKPVTGSWTETSTSFLPIVKYRWDVIIHQYVATSQIGYRIRT